LIYPKALSWVYLSNYSKAFCFGILFTVIVFIGKENEPFALTPLPN
jgi:hypothetical protein